jgi:hypothetical protein
MERASSKPIAVEGARAPAELHAQKGASAYLVDASVHRVRTGDTPASIAAIYGVPWEEITQFNWGTTEAATVEEHFREDLGCARKTPDGRAMCSMMRTIRACC